jgi:hypothetical protein
MVDITKSSMVDYPQPTPRRFGVGTPQDVFEQGAKLSAQVATWEQLMAVNLEIGALKSVLIKAGVCTDQDLDTALERLKEIWHGVL